MSAPLLLASSSPARGRLLARLGVPFHAVPHQVDEAAAPDLPPEALPVWLAVEKARSVAEPGAYVLGSDQICVSDDGLRLGKPGTRAAAEAQLARLAGRTHRLLTGVALLAPDGRVESHLEIATLTMRPLSEGEIARYVERDDPVGSAGSYLFESLGVALFRRVETADPSGIEGLPLLWVAEALRGAGFAVP